MGETTIALTIDVEGSAAKLPARIDVLLDLFADAGVKSTFFVLGECAESAPRVVAEIAKAGHEIGFHGYRHVPISELRPSKFASQAREWRTRLEDLGQQPVRGFRAPYFSINQSAGWALDTVASAGFAYDSSIYPGLHDRFGWLGAPRTPARIRGMRLVEFPVPVLGRLLPIAFSGGGYLRLLPWFVILWGFRRQSRRWAPGMIYAHPWEMETTTSRIRKRRPQDSRRGNWPEVRQSLTGQLGRRQMRVRFERLLKFNGCRFMPMATVLSAFEDLPEWDPKVQPVTPNANASQHRRCAG